MNHIHTLADLLPDSAVDLNLSSNGKSGTIDRLLDRLQQSSTISDRDRVYRDLLAREEQGSTALGRGVALPHAKTAGANQPAIAFGRCNKGLDFDALDGKEVHLVFLFVAPPERSGLHMRLMAALTRFLRSESNRRRLMDAQDAAGVRRLLNQVSVP